MTSTKQRSRSPSSAADLNLVKANIAALVAAMFLLVASPVAAQDDLPSAGLQPADTGPSDPSGGNTFFLETEPGQSVTGRARVVNPADQPLEIKLYLRDLVYNDQGNPSIVEGEQTDVGSWGAFAEEQVTLGPRERRVMEFVVTPPAGAEPGDHIGVVVAESRAFGEQLQVVKRNSVRLYVTIPGDARRSFEIDSVKSGLDSILFPDIVTAEVLLRNTGRIRLRPSISVGDEQAEGSEVLLSRTNEKYSAELKVPWYGGLIRMSVVATADQGLTRRVNHTKFVIPWGLLILLATAAGAIFLLKKYWWDRRVSRVASLQADLRRIEALVARRPGLETGEVPEFDDEQEEIHAILAGIKRARRTGSQSSLGRLALTLHETTGDALEYLVEALEKAEVPAREELLAAASSYGPAALANDKGVSRLQTETATELMLRASGAEPKPNGSSASKKPTPKGTTPKKPIAKNDSKPRKKKSPQRTSNKKNQRIRPDRRSPK